MTYSEIDNPGKGNCAFYGFSVGLIDIIKHEYARNDASPTFSALQNKAVGDFDISLDEVVNFDYYNQSIELLDKMQQCLRTILLEHRKQDIINNNQGISASNTYVNFAEMVRNYVRHQSTSPYFNELAKSDGVRRYARQVAVKIQKLSRWYPEKNENNAYSWQREAYFDNIIEKAFRDDVFVAGNYNQMKQGSLIVNAMSDITRNYRWGTQTDLNELAAIFDVNLHTLINGKTPYTPVDKPQRPIITMNNKHNTHWTTRLSFVGSGFTGRQYDAYTKNSVITKKEIKDIMQTYTKGFMALMSTRNHKEKANQIIERCNDNDFNVHDIVRMLDNYLKPGKFAPNSSFKRRADYIMARAEYFNEASASTSSISF